MLVNFKTWATQYNIDSEHYSFVEMDWMDITISEYSRALIFWREFLNDREQRIVRFDNSPHNPDEIKINNDIFFTQALTWMKEQSCL